MQQKSPTKEEQEILKGKAIQLLEILSQEELTTFEKWLPTAITERKKDILKLFSILKAFQSKDSRKKLRKGEVYKKLHPGRAFNKKILLNTMSKLTTSIERFLIERELERDKNLQQLLLARALKRKNEPEKEIKCLLNLAKKLEDTPILEHEDHHTLMLINQRLYRHPASQKWKDEIIAYLIKAEKHLDTYFLKNKIYMTAEHVEIQRVKKKDIKLPTCLDLIDEFRVGLLDQEYFNIYKKHLHNYAKPVKERFHQLKSDFNQYLFSLNMEEKSTLLVNLLNEAARLRLESLQEGLEETLEIYKIGLEGNILTKDDQISPTTYGNIAAISNTLGQYTFLKQFVACYTKYLPPKVQEDASTWALTHCDYLQGEIPLSELITKISHKKKEYTTFSLRIRVLATQINFDALLKEDAKIDDAFWNYNEAFAKKLRREKNYGTKTIEALERFTQFCRQLAVVYRIPPGPRRLAKFEKLQEEITNTSSMHAKEWLKSRVELIGKRITG